MIYSKSASNGGFGHQETYQKGYEPEQCLFEWCGMFCLNNNLS